MTASASVRARRPEIGDMASHKTRQLDPRPVAEVSADGRQVWLEFPAGYVYGPFPSKNYDFRAVTR